MDGRLISGSQQFRTWEWQKSGPMRLLRAHHKIINVGSSGGCNLTPGSAAQYSQPVSQALNIAQQSIFKLLQDS
ncbi:MAG TPA: hypothetical protein DCF63_07165 [Planctomycetaceae bacterium]|nr:hypothetical protein [Planctomycetaceae bacterium]